jgi:exodeoxyribonuclease V beta subunit
VSGAAGPPTFDAASAPLTGINLVEANAGTGKTWAITALYVRLLVESGCTVDSVLVVTFTEAAAGELRERIRARLVRVRRGFSSGQAEDEDTLTRELLCRTPDRAEAFLKLTAALRDFDQAPVYTIHAFCQRVLGDGAFDAGMPFRTEILPDQSALLTEVAEDFWRKEVHEASPLFTRFLVKRCANPARLLNEEIERTLGKPYVEIRAPAKPKDLPALEREFEQAYAEARGIWLAEREAVGHALLGAIGLNAQKYRKAVLPGWLEEMHACLSPESPQLDLCNQFQKFTPDALRDGTNQNGRTPSHRFFDACGRLHAAHTALLNAFEAHLVLTRVRLIDYCNTELAARKERRHLQSYDDLLLNLSDALAGERGTALAEKLRERYRAALIDEFQDTDPLQYGIFRRIYAGSDCPLFLVGDPKQAIYSFRGADVFAYIKARSDARTAYALDTNWRSTEPLLTAVNRVFDNAARPFVLDEIDFTPSRPAPGDRGRLVIEGDSGAPFTIWNIEATGTKAVTKGEAGIAATGATAWEIARLVELGRKGQARIVDRGGEHPLRGGDIAVLVRSHRQGAAMRDALAEVGVASVQRGSSSVFASHEAEELQRILAAIAEPGREALVGAALATEMMGYSGEEVYALCGDERRWDALIESFRTAHREWHDFGFIRMLRAFIETHDVLVKVLNHRDGERRATNLLHLAELLHCNAERLGIAGLLAWLGSKRAHPAQGNEAELLRLESDENLVKILTVHVAKGLEFPVVFYPFAWDGNLRAGGSHVIRFHDRAAGYQPVVDFGSPALDASRGQAVLEERAENLRLLYVALTRARYRMWMTWGNVNDASLAAPAWLLHRPPVNDALQALVGDHPPELSHQRVAADLARLAGRAEAEISVMPLPEVEADTLRPVRDEAPALVPRRFERILRDADRVTSFTALAHGRTIEAPDYDASDQQPEPATAAGHDIFAFPRGARAGKCLHAVFEQIDFARLSAADLERVVTKELTAHGFDRQWSRPVSDMVEAVIDTPLDSGGMRLKSVTRDRRLDELEFYYPIAALSDHGLRRILMAGGFPDVIRATIGNLTFLPVQGYMRGFIDLVYEHDGRYYLADYKSNWLGANIGAYDQAALSAAMSREAYYLQYLVYCVALHRYLRSRLRDYTYDTHFGGIRYLFVRGMTPRGGPQFGVFADRPSVELINALDEYLMMSAGA